MIFEYPTYLPTTADKQEYDIHGMKGHTVHLIIFIWMVMTRLENETDI